MKAIVALCGRRVAADRLAMLVRQKSRKGGREAVSHVGTGRYNGNVIVAEKQAGWEKGFLYGGLVLSLQK